MTLAPFLCCQRCIVAQIDPINGRHGLNMAGRKLLDKDYIASTARYTATITGPGISRIVEISFSAKMVKKKPIAGGHHTIDVRLTVRRKFAMLPRSRPE